MTHARSLLLLLVGSLSVSACSTSAEESNASADATTLDAVSGDVIPGDAGVIEDASPEDTADAPPDTADAERDADAEHEDADSDVPVPDAAEDPALDTAADPDVLPIAAHCELLHAGEVTGFPVGPLTRSFELYLPVNVDSRRDWPVVFGWHGFGEAARAIASFLRAEVNGPNYEFIYVVPDDIGLELPFGADWDNLDLSDGSLEAELFDAVLECLDARWGLDTDRVHSIGFSSGAITTNSLGILRGDRLASVASLSGGYWSNPANANPVASWPDTPSRSPRYAQLLTWGGVSDTAFGYSFALMAANDQIYLNARGHDVIACDHGGGHALPDEPNGAAIARFFAAHPRGVEASPWTAGFPEGYPLPWCLVFPGAR